MIKAVIFDMDGTMVDSEKLWIAVMEDFALRYGARMDQDIRRLMMGKKESDALSEFKKYFDLKESVEELARVRKPIILKDVSMIRINKGLLDLLDLLDRLKIKKAVATSSFREFTFKVLSSLELEKRFDAIVTGDDISLGKPHPQIFLKAAKLLDVQPEECLVLEDAENGVEAAHRAGMHVIAIPHGHSKDHDFSLADKVLSSMLEVNENLLASF